MQLLSIPLTGGKSAHAGAKPYRAVRSIMDVYPFFELYASFISY